MKKSILSLFAGMITLISVNAQAPVNFTCNDCASNSHDLFAELSTGKVIVIAWVMPCGSCIAPTITASNVVASYASSNPGQVKMYVADDAANTSCTSLNSWVNSNSIVADAVFSNSSVIESDYGSGGMPKIVVLGGGATPTTFFNQNGSAAGNSTNLQNAINNALATGINDPKTMLGSIEIYPNPSNLSSTLTFTSTNSDEGTVVVYDQLGQVVVEVFSGSLKAGENKFEINTDNLASGIYSVAVISSEANSVTRLVIAH